MLRSIQYVLLLTATSACGYAPDASGNLLWRTNHTLIKGFANDSLNQLERVTRSGTLTVAGRASSLATRCAGQAGAVKVGMRSG